MNPFIRASALFILIAGAVLPGRAAEDTRRPAVETIPGSLVKFELVRIPGGTLAMADPARGGVPRRVQINPFWLGKTEVTWDEYDIFAFRLDLTEPQKASGVDAVSRPSKPYGAPDRGFGHHGYPALAMTFHAAEQYCQWLSTKTGKKYRLPSEAEWEYACRAGGEGSGTARRGAQSSPGAKATALDQQSWFWDNAEDKTHPVATKAPNAWGVYDMLGNVAEWCQGSDGKPVVRGGSYNDHADRINCAARQRPSPDWDATDPQIPKSRWWLSDAPFVGFRVVREE